MMCKTRCAKFAVFTLAFVAGCSDGKTAVAIDGPQAAIDGAIDAAPGVPQWFADLPVGQWAEVPGTTLTSVTTDAGPVGAGILHDYNGLGLKRDDSTLIAFGGGHAGYSGNEVLGLTLAAAVPQWQVVVQPTPIADRVIASNDQATPALWWGPAGQQKPNPPHTYNSLQFSTELGRAIWYGQTSVWNYSGTPPGGNMTLSVIWGARRWAQPGSAEDLGVAMATRVTTQDPAGNVYVASGQRVFKHVPLTNTWTEIANNGSLNYSAFGALAYDTKRNRLFRLGDYNASAPRLITLAGAVSTPALSGPMASALETLAGLDTFGMVYDPINDRYVAPTGMGGSFYAIDAESFAVTLVQPAGVQPANKPNPAAGVYSHIQYLPQLHGLAYVPNANANVFVMRL